MGNKISSLQSRQKPKFDSNKRCKNRGSGLVSSFRRSASLRRMSWAPRPRLDCRAWLTQLQLSQYEDAFSRFGGVEELLYYDERQIRDEIGVKISSDRARICSSLVCLRDKYEKNQKLRVDQCPRISLNIDGGSHEDGVSFSLDAPDGVVLRSGRRCPSPTAQKKREAFVISPQVSENDSTTMSRCPLREERSDVELRRLLESELALDGADLRSHAWYHGAVSRARAEDVVRTNGSFLIRDCISQPGDFVLSCRWNNSLIHVIIQKTIVQPNTIYEKIQYKLEDIAYDSISDLVTAYVGSKKPVTQLSGARICTPVNRTAPLSFYVSKYAAEAEFTRAHGSLTRLPIKNAQRSDGFVVKEPVPVGCSVVRTYTRSPGRARRCSSSSLKNSGLADSESIPNTLSKKDNSASHQPLSRKCASTLVLASSTSSPADQTDQNKLLSKSSLGIIQEINPPPKPNRTPSFRQSQNDSEQTAHESPPAEQIYTEIEDSEDAKKRASNGTSVERVCDASPELTNAVLNSKNGRLSELYQSSGSDSGNGSGDSIQTSVSDYRNRDSQFSICDNGSFLVEDDSMLEDQTEAPLDPCPPSAFDVDAFSTLLLPAIENRPLDPTALTALKNILKETGSRILAAHLTRIDLDLLNSSPGKVYKHGVSTGIELITLPQGSQLRKDLIERTECLKLLVCVIILKCEEANERAEMIFHWIQVAIDAKAAMGNLFGFTAIMLGLCSPEVQRLSATWHLVRQKFTDSAFEFESKLRSTLKAMNECRNPQAPNTTIPHILPFVLLWERDPEDIYSLHNQIDSLLHWEGGSSDYGLQVILDHLQEGLMFTRNLTSYTRNAELIFGQEYKTDDLTLDMFRTEFHLKFLFGSKAALVTSEQRLPKFMKVVQALSECCEPSMNHDYY